MRKGESNSSFETCPRVSLGARSITASHVKCQVVPAGCSKTTLARAAATASGASFQALAGTQLYTALLGEGEASLRSAFARARAAAPAIIFLDELDALAGNRGSIGNERSESGPGLRLLSALLTEMDGMELAKGDLASRRTPVPLASASLH